MIKKLSKLAGYYRMLDKEPDNYECYQANDSEVLKEAKVLHANVYFSKGYVKPDEINEEGILHAEGDPYQKFAHYFVVRRVDTQKVVALGRLIYAPPDTVLADFQMLTHMALFEEEKPRILRHGVKHALEVSAVVKAPGESSLAVLLLYREMWRFSLQNKCQVWLMACNSNLFTSLKTLFGSALHQVGPRQPFRNHQFVPAMVELEPAYKILSRNSAPRRLFRNPVQHKLAAFFMRDLPPISG